MTVEIILNLGDLKGLRDGDMQACNANGEPVLVCRVAGKLYAVEDLCSHAESTLSDGFLDGYHVVCPLHGAMFDVRDGTHLGPPAFTGIRHFDVVEGAGGATVTITPRKKPDPGPGAPGMFRTR